MCGCVLAGRSHRRQYPPPFRTWPWKSTCRSHRKLHRPLAAAAIRRWESHQRIRHRGARINEHALRVAYVRSSEPEIQHRLPEHGGGNPGELVGCGAARQQPLGLRTGGAKHRACGELQGPQEVRGEPECSLPPGGLRGTAHMCTLPEVPQGAENTLRFWQAIYDSRNTRTVIHTKFPRVSRRA